MSKLERAVRIDAPADNVWDVVADLGELDMWSPSLLYDERNCLRGTDYQMSPGSQTTRIVEWETGRRIGYAVSGLAGVNSLRNNISVEPRGDDTTVVYTINFEVDESEADRLDVAKEFELYMDESLACLKHYAETN